jgi:thiamine-monophosphate kinase
MTTAKPADLQSEEAIIAEFWAPLAAGFAGAFGLKDDCAAITPEPGHDLVVTTDGLIAGVHFIPGEDPGAIAWKALAVNVSDLVAKGATPLAYVLSLALPGATERAWLGAFAGGLQRAQAAFGCSLIGGDTDRTLGPLSVSITAFGTVPNGRMVRRSTAAVGDAVYVSGTIGDATLGLALVRNPALAHRCGLDAAAQAYLDARFRLPQPPVGLRSALLGHARAAMDISDGLVKDFGRLCRASNVGGEIDATAVPLAAAARAVVAAGGATLADLITGGEDYEVLAAIAPHEVEKFEAAATAAGTPVTRIGSIVDGRQGLIVHDGSAHAMAFTRTGWDHFGD